MVVPLHLLYPGGESERSWLEEIVAIRHRHDFVLRVGKRELNDLLDGETVVG